MISLFVFTVPWLGAIAVLSNLGIHLLGHNVTIWTVLGALVSIAALIQQYWIRTQLEQTVQLPRRYWWLSGIGGLVVAAIAIGSWIKTGTGWGWTWRGRKLRLDA